MQKLKELPLLFSKLLIVTVLVSSFFFSQLQMVPLMDSCTTRNEATEIERILEECGIEVYTIRWAQINYAASNRRISKVYDIVGNVNREERSKYVSVIWHVESDTILYQDEISYILSQGRSRIWALIIEALEEYPAEWKDPLNLSLLMMVIDGYEVSVQDASIIFEIPFELPEYSSSSYA